MVINVAPFWHNYIAVYPMHFGDRRAVLVVFAQVNDCYLRVVVAIQCRYPSLILVLVSTNKIHAPIMD